MVVIGRGRRIVGTIDGAERMRKAAHAPRDQVSRRRDLTLQGTPAVGAAE